MPIAFAEVVVGSPVAKPATSSTVEVEWSFNTEVDPIWQDYFIAAPELRAGSIEYVHGPGPRITGKEVHWTVPVTALENAYSIVKAKTSAANTEYRADLTRRKSEREAQEARQRINAETARQAQAVLDNLD